MASRDGDLYVDAPAAADVTVALAAKQRIVVSVGDIIEFVESRNLKMLVKFLVISS